MKKKVRIKLPSTYFEDYCDDDNENNNKKQ